MKKSKEKYINTLLLMLENEIDLMSKFLKDLDVEEQKSRIYLIVDKLGFISATLSSNSDEEKKLNQLMDRLETLFNDLTMGTERLEFISQFGKTELTRESTTGKMIEENVNRNKERTYMLDTGDKTSGVYLHGVVAQDVLDVLEKYIQKGLQSTPEGERRADITTILNTSSKVDNERLSAFEQYLIHCLLEVKTDKEEKQL